MPRTRQSRGHSASEPASSAPLADEARALVETLRAVAAQIEAGAAPGARSVVEPATTTKHDAPAQAAARPAREVVAPPLDPFAVLRQLGEQGLRQALAPLDLAALKAIVRAYRLDPARITARWTASERIIELIVEQAVARLNHGRAFERV
jgi:hypothetical protein